MPMLPCSIILQTCPVRLKQLIQDQTPFEVKAFSKLATSNAQSGPSICYLDWISGYAN